MAFGDAVGQGFVNSPIVVFIVGVAPNTQIELKDVGGVGQLLFLLNNALFGNGLMESAVTGGVGQIVLNGPKLLSLADFVGIVLNSNNGSGTANIGFIYNDSLGTAHVYATLNDAGFGIIGSLTPVQPGTGTSPSNPAVGESWHAATLINGWTGSGSGVNGAWYRYNGVGETEVIFDIVNTTATGNSQFMTLPAAYSPATNQNHGGVNWNNPQLNNSPSVPWVFVGFGGGVQLTAIEVANKSLFGYIKIPLAAL